MNTLILLLAIYGAFSLTVEIAHTILDAYMAHLGRRIKKAHERLRRAQLETGRRLASQREDLIVQGVDPADLAIPLAPNDDEETR